MDGLTTPRESTPEVPASESGNDSAEHRETTSPVGFVMGTPPPVRRGEPRRPSGAGPPSSRGIVPRDPYCVEVEVLIQSPMRDGWPAEHAWTPLLVRDVFSSLTAGLVEAVTTHPGRAFLFFGRRSLNEGLSHPEAEDRARECESVYNWVGKPAYCNASIHTLQAAWDHIARAVGRSIAQRHLGERGYCPGTTTSEPEESGEEEGELVGEAPGGGAEGSGTPEVSRTRDGQPVRGRGAGGSRRGSGRTSSVARPEGSVRAGIGTPTVARRNSHRSRRRRRTRGTGSDTDESEHSGREGGKRDHGRIQLPQFNDPKEGAKVTYRQWKHDVRMQRESFTDRAVMRAAIYSLSGDPGELARSLPVGATLDQLLLEMDRVYGRVGTFHDQHGALFQLEQRHGENVQSYAVRVQSAISSLQEEWPVDFATLDEAALRADRFYAGLIPSIQDRLEYMWPAPGTGRKPSYNELLVTAKQVEEKAQKRAKKRSADGVRYDSGGTKSYGRPPPKSVSARAAAASFPAEEPVDESGPPEESVESGEDDEVSLEHIKGVFVTPEMESACPGLSARVARAFHKDEKTKGACFNCGDPNHWQRSCTKPNTRKGNLNGREGTGKTEVPAPQKSASKPKSSEK